MRKEYSDYSRLVEANALAVAGALSDEDAEGLRVLLGLSDGPGPSRTTIQRLRRHGLVRYVVEASAWRWDVGEEEECVLGQFDRIKAIADGLSADERYTIRGGTGIDCPRLRSLGLVDDEGRTGLGICVAERLRRLAEVADG